MPYDTSLDEKLFEKYWENDASRVVVSVYSYNKGVKKMQVIRQIKDRDGNFTFAKLGRMTKEEAEGVLPLMQEAIKEM